ncbi:MAG: phenylacetate--CoA ligase [Planctomycetia bacterium]|nr:phenylacetate--CoA ligase [Planctomycetia bacterium]
MNDSVLSTSYFNPISSTDYLPLSQMRELQTVRLQKIVNLAYEQVPLYRERMAEMGVSPRHIQNIKDISLLPFTKKTDLRDTYPRGMFAAEMKEIVRFHASSGTTGKPIVVAYTQSDLDVWREVVARSLASFGVQRGDIVQNAYGYGLFTGGLGLHMGIECLGATVVPVSVGNTERQIMLMRDLGSTAISCTPSYFLHLIDQAMSMGVDMRELPLRIGIFGAEPWTEAMRARVEQMTSIKAYDIYGLSEMAGPGVGAECYCQDGMHIFEDHFYPEIIHPETLEVLPDGEEGELVLSTLSKRAMPMLRYRTRDITKIETSPCPCGRTIRRIHRISRRSDDMLIIRGINVFPSQIETAIMRVEGTLPHYQIILTRVGGLDQVEIKVEIDSELFDGDIISSYEKLQKELVYSVERIIGLKVKITMVAPRTLRRSEGKLQRVIDERKF